MEMFWEKESWELVDPHLKALSEAPFSRPFPSLSLAKGIFILRGPRQVGKSSWLKTILSEELKKGQSCFYHSCETLRDFSDLLELLRSLRGRNLVMLDEITFVDEWARAVKHEADQGTLQTLIVTGSNAIDLRRGSERLPGRLAGGKEIELLPMDFSEFEQMWRQAEWKPRPRVQMLEHYFHIGGFPSALIESGEKGIDPVNAKDTYKRWLVGDVLRTGKQELYLREIVGQLALTIGTPLSLQKLAQRTQIGSHHTAQDYVAVLEDCFALRTLYAIDPNSGALRFRKEKKFYFTDPLLFWIALEWSGHSLPPDALPKIAEMVAGEALLRRYQRVGYYSSSKGEVDFYKHRAWALEVKWSSIVANLSRAYFDIKVPHKLVWSQVNFLEEWPE